MATIDYRDNMWLVEVVDVGSFGFWTLAAARSFAVNNLKLSFKLTNRAIVAQYR